MRIVVIKPSHTWGGGLLGVEFGQGIQNNFRSVQSAYQEYRNKEIEKLGGTPQQKKRVNSLDSPAVGQNVIKLDSSPTLKKDMSQEEFLNQVLSPSNPQQ